MDIVMIGPQGSGKGTQSVLIAEKLGIPHISLGALFRAEIKQRTDIGKEIDSILLRGDIVPADIAEKVLHRRLQNTDAENGVIVDGFPRTLDQADILENILHDYGRKVDHVIYLNISDNEALRRLSGRRVCKNGACERNYHIEYNPPKKEGVCDVCLSPLVQRKDDNPEAISHRLSIFHKETVPLIELYRGLGVLREIDGSKSIDHVHRAILDSIGVP